MPYLLLFLFLFLLLHKCLTMPSPTKNSGICLEIKTVLLVQQRLCRFLLLASPVFRQFRRKMQVCLPEIGAVSISEMKGVWINFLFNLGHSKGKNPGRSGFRFCTSPKFEVLRSGGSVHAHLCYKVNIFFYTSCDPLLTAVHGV